MPKQSWKLPKDKTWRAKLEKKHPNHGKLVPIPPAMQKTYGKGKMLIPRPLDVDALVKKVRCGRLITTGQIRERLAKAARATQTCPLCTGIFMRIVAEAAEEDRRAGKKKITPWWRVIRDDGTLNEKMPGGTFCQSALLRKEGRKTLPGKRKNTRAVADFSNHHSR